MSMHRAMHCRLDEDLSQLTHFLRRQGVPHRITEERGRQVIWTRDEVDAEIVRGVYAQGVPESTASQRPSGGGARLRLAWQQMLRLIPVTMAVLLITAVVAVITRLGSELQTIALFTFTPITPTGYIAAVPDMAQWWRLIAPMFLHFGWMHLAFNALWYWELGRRIELRSGAWWLLGLTVLFALVSNTAQWLFGGPAIFGGLSGVLYGLLGYCWLYQLLAPNVHFALPKGVVVMMLGWLVLCLSGVVTLLGFGAIANAAHVGGLVIGCLCGAVAGGLQRRR
ncbi:GlpG protein [Halopseudomonas litoralis]|uniref:GlpG protein n=1 Tax=Halopseudomonas litoralis TaxID=797277 RepID=A0A1H1PC74_9GAMM|nr:rhomboid family intramembrane serine protease [Halopseudomonas litoralis]SDS08724.1 GlpG protein [Halopseudomonas litoralis]